MNDVRHQLQRVQTVLIALIVALVGFCLMVLAWHLKPGDPLAFFPVSDIGGLLFSSGLLGIGIDYLLRRNTEAIETERLARVLTDHAPALRDAVIDGFAFSPTDLARVSTPETLDKVITNSLGIRLGDPDFAEEIYAGLLAETIRSSERWHDTNVSLRLLPLTTAEPHITPRRKQPAAADPALFVVIARWEYTVIPTNPTRRFVCVSDPTEYRDLADDSATTSVWFFKPIGSMTAADPDAFELLAFSVNGEDRSIRRTSRTTSQAFTVAIGKEHVQAGKPVTISYTYRTLVRQRGNMLNIELEQPSRGLDVELDYSGCGIEQVRLLDFMPISGQIRVFHTPPSVPPKTVKLECDGWVLPRSGAAFVWVLEDEQPLVLRP